MRKIYTLLLSLILLPYIGVAQDTDAGSDQEPVDDHYSINYEEETITIAEGYEVYTEATDGEKIESGGSITAYIGQSLYIQKTDPESSARTAISIPARPQAPNVSSVTIDYSEEKLSFPPGVTETTLEYALSQSDPNWQDVPSGAALAEMGWDGTAIYLYFRTGATDSDFASEATQTPITIPARPAAPTDLNLMDYTDVSVTYYVGEGVQCRLGNEGTWVTLGQNETDHTFTGLTPQTTYTIYARNPATDSQFASAEASDEVTTKSSAAEPPEMTYEVTANSITLSYSATWQYQTADDEWISVEGSKEFTSLEAATEYTFTVRVAESETAEASKVGTVTVYTAHATPTEGTGYTISYRDETATATTDYEILNGESWTTAAVPVTPGSSFQIRHAATEGGAPASEPLTVQVAERPTAPTNLTHTDETLAGMNNGTISGVTEEMVYKLSTADEWTRCSGTTITGLAPGTYQVRRAVTETSFAGEAASVTIAPGPERTYTIRVVQSTGGTISANKTEAAAGQTVTLSYSESSNYDFRSWNVTDASGTPVPVSGNSFVMPASDVTVSATFDYDPPYIPPSYYDLYFDSSENDSVRYDCSDTNVREGGTFSFYVEVVAGYDSETLVVEYKKGRSGRWREVTPNSSGRYRITNVHADIYVRSSVEPLHDPTAIEQVGSGQTQVRCDGERILLSAAEPLALRIVSLSGQVIRTQRIPAGDTEISDLPAGFYVVLLSDGTRQKVLLR